MNLLKLLSRSLKEERKKFAAVPRHLAIIMDGNGRWAKQRGLPRSAGHRAGMERIRDVVAICLDYGIPYLTLYAFSTENWTRPQEEVQYLMDLFQEALQKEVAQLHQQGIKVKFIGIKDNLDPGLIRLMEDSEIKTASNTRLTLNIALNYGGRREIITAVKEIGRAIRRGELDPEQIKETDLTNRLFTAGQPDPDLLIRPGGESRISNFLIWQSAYTELYFSRKLWPDFGRNDFLEALEFYSRRERRFGGIQRREPR